MMVVANCDKLKERVNKWLFIYLFTTVLSLYHVTSDAMLISECIEKYVAESSRDKI
jgi:hypothetical protein